MRSRSPDRAGPNRTGPDLQMNTIPIINPLDESARRSEPGRNQRVLWHGTRPQVYLNRYQNRTWVRQKAGLLTSSWPCSPAEPRRPAAEPESTSSSSELQAHAKTQEALVPVPSESSFPSAGPAADPTESESRTFLIGPGLGSDVTGAGRTLRGSDGRLLNPVWLGKNQNHRFWTRTRKLRSTEQTEPRLIWIQLF